MPTVSLKAHYDGEHILLDEPFNLPANARLIVTILPEGTDHDREAWANLAGNGLANAYREDEPEYSITDLKP
ncbi:MAG: hypothetical protein HC889_20285 [Synechococcaceae cyanobacterium SM1_2_3]|jgi:hypothetical protein|nr:hypothetical protein [Synechococcaceae cyanobacterium SM1_2_3]